MQTGYKTQVKATWGLDNPAGCLGNTLALVDPCSSLLCSSCCFDIEGCDFEEGGFCILGLGILGLGILGAELFAAGVATFFTIELGVFEGMPFGAKGRPGPVPLLLLCCFLESICDELGLLAEGNLLETTLEDRCPFMGTDFLSPWFPWTCLPLFPNACLLLTGTWASLVSSTSAKNLYKFPQWK